MELYRYATSVYGQKVLIGASWEPLLWFVGVGAAFIVLHALVKALGLLGKPERV